MSLGVLAADHVTRLGLIGASAALLSPPDQPTSNRWRLTEGQHWQIASPGSEDPETTDAARVREGIAPPAWWKSKA
jgi:hypothetical protein